MFGIGLPELIIILLVVLVLFGAGKLPGVMGEVGKGINQLKKGLQGDELNTPAASAPQPQPSAKKTTTAKKTAPKKKAAAKSVKGKATQTTKAKAASAKAKPAAKKTAAKKTTKAKAKPKA